MKGRKREKTSLVIGCRALTHNTLKHNEKLCYLCIHENCQTAHKVINAGPHQIFRTVQLMCSGCTSGYEGFEHAAHNHGLHALSKRFIPSCSKIVSKASLVWKHIEVILGAVHEARRQDGATELRLRHEWENNNTSKKPSAHKRYRKGKNYKAHMQGKGTKGLHTCKCLWPDNSLGPNNQVMLPHYSIKFFLLVLKKQGF